MHSFKAKIDFDIKCATVKDLLITALEGGSNYWMYGVKPLERSSKADHASDRYYDDLMMHGFSMLDKTDQKCHIVRPGNFGEALVLMASQYPKHFKDVVNETGDAITGDVYLQLMVHKKVIYG